MKNILVTGGAGYIGSFIVRALKEKGFNPIIVDNLSSGYKVAVKDFELHVINLVKDVEALNSLFVEKKFEGVVHMAGFIQMGESFENPMKYFENNLVSTTNLFKAMIKHKVKNIVFSSSAGVYGNPKKLPITEDMERKPLNPYGETKYIIERMLSWMDKSHDTRFAAIRYFNAAGAAIDGSIGEDHPNESHLIPLAIKAIQEEKEFTIFGDDYETLDGTNIRDYIHVMDLADTHIIALENLLKGGKSDYFNAGVGKGYSNKEIVEMIEGVAGRKMKLSVGERRKGDADSLFASIEKISSKFNWKPRFGLKEIVESAYKWHTKFPEGYKK